MEKGREIMEPLEITLASMLIGKVLDELAFRYGGNKYPKLKEYTGLFGLILKIAAGRK